MKKLFLIPLIIVLAVGLVFGGCGKPAEPTAPTTPTAPAEPTVSLLKFVTFLPTFTPNVHFAKEFEKRVNEQGTGLIQVEYTGGPEVIPGFDQMAAVRSGAIDMIFSPASYYGPLLPESNVIHLTQETPMEQRANGFVDLMVEFHERVGTYYLGRWSANIPLSYNFNIWLNQPIETMADLKGLRLRTGAIYDEFLKAMGINPVTLGWPDVYDAASRGVIDGAAGSGLEMPPDSYAEVFKYVVYPSFYEQDLVILVNLDTWNSLTKEQQDLLSGVVIGFEPEMAEFFTNALKGSRAKMKEGGLQEIHLSPDEAETYINLAYSTAWEVAKETIKPDDFAKIQELMPYSAKYLK